MTEKGKGRGEREAGRKEVDKHTSLSVINLRPAGRLEEGFSISAFWAPPKKRRPDQSDHKLLCAGRWAS